MSSLVPERSMKWSITKAGYHGRRLSHMRDFPTPVLKNVSYLGNWRRRGNDGSISQGDHACEDLLLDCVDELRGRSVVGAAGCGAADGAAGSAGNVFQQDTRNFHEASACGDADCTGEIRSDGFPAAIFTLHRTVADPAIESADIRYGVSAVIGARSEDGAEGRDYGGEGFAARR